MKGFVIGMIVVVVVIIIGLGVILGMGLMGTLPDFGFIGEPELVNRQSWDASSLDDISVIYKSESITLLPSSGDEVVLEEYMSRSDERMLARVNQNGSTLNIESGERPITILSFWRAKIKVYVPSKWLGDLELGTSSGSVRSEDSFAFKSFRATSKSGSVRMKGIETDGDITMTASSGSVSSEHLNAGGRVELSSTSGSVKPGRVTAQEITGKSSSGSVRFESAGAQRVTASSSSGGVSFDRLDGEFDLHSSSGSVRVEAGNAYGRAESSSGGGNVTIDKLVGNITLSAKSGSSKLYLPSDSSFNFEGRVNSGSIRTPNNDGLAFNQSGKRATGSFGSDPQYNVDMESSSGSVNVEWN